MTADAPYVDDAALPPGAARPPRSTNVRADVSYRNAVWTPEDLATLCDQLAVGAGALTRTDPTVLRSGWEETVAEFLPPNGTRWPALEPALRRLTGLSPSGLQAGVETVLGGVTGAPLRALFESASAHRSDDVQPPVLVVLSSNLPALAVQALVACLALRRAVLVKSPSSEPLFAPAFVRALGGRVEALRGAWAAATWPGGDERLEQPLLARVDPIVAYGESTTIDSLRARAAGRVVAFGPKLSFAYVRRGAAIGEAARGLARDIALFDQRGCLSVQAVFVEEGAAPAEAMAEVLADALREAAATWPPGPLDAAVAARVHALRAEYDMRGLPRPELALDAGTVLLEPELTLHPTPGLRTVRVHPMADAAALLAALEPWRGQLQGLALAGELSKESRAALAHLGVSRIAPPGRLQDADALWHNGGVHPLAPLGRPPETG